MKKVLILLIMSILAVTAVSADNMITVFTGIIVDANTDETVGADYKIDVYCYQNGNPSEQYFVGTTYTTSSGSFSTTLNNMFSEFTCQYGDYGYIIVDDQFTSDVKMIEQDLDFDYVRIDQKIQVPEFTAMTAGLAGLASLGLFLKKRK